MHVNLQSHQRASIRSIVPASSPLVPKIAVSRGDELLQVANMHTFEFRVYLVSTCTTVGDLTHFGS